MRTKRVFSHDVLHSESFIEMPSDCKILYIYLNMNADDEGFIEPKRIMRMISANEDSIKILIAKSFVIPFEEGVVVIRHWRQHNNSDKYNFSPTLFSKQRKQIVLDLNKNYILSTTVEPISLESDWSQTEISLQDKIRKDKIRKDKIIKDKIIASTNVSAHPTKKEVTFTEAGAKVIKAFEAVDGKNKLYYSNKTQRASADYLIAQYGLEKVLQMIEVLPQTNQQPFIPKIYSPYDLQEKWVKLIDSMKSKVIEKTAKKRIVLG